MFVSTPYEQKIRKVFHPPSPQLYQTVISALLPRESTRSAEDSAAIEGANHRITWALRQTAAETRLLLYHR